MRTGALGNHSSEILMPPEYCGSCWCHLQAPIVVVSPRHHRYHRSEGERMVLGQQPIATAMVDPMAAPARSAGWSSITKLA